MKKRVSVYIALVILMSIVSGCSSAQLIEAENGKKYFVDKKTCETYKLKNNGKMYCYVEGNECKATVYSPVCSGCTSKVCRD